MRNYAVFSATLHDDSELGHSDERGTVDGRRQTGVISSSERSKVVSRVETVELGLAIFVILLQK